jgi:hypothetical protein
MTRASFFFHFTAQVYYSQLVFVIFWGFISYNPYPFVRLVFCAHRFCAIRAKSRREAAVRCFAAADFPLPLARTNSLIHARGCTKNGMAVLLAQLCRAFSSLPWQGRPDKVGFLL